jgi:hypothetical protein
MLRGTVWQAVKNMTHQRCHPLGGWGDEGVRDGAQRALQL